MSFWRRLFGHKGESSTADQINVRITKSGVTRMEAATSFGVEAAEDSFESTKYAFGFRKQRRAAKAGALCPGDVRQFLLAEPEVQVYTDGTCNLMLVLDEGIRDDLLLSLARHMKQNGGAGFWSSGAMGDTQDRMMQIFNVDKAVRIREA